MTEPHTPPVELLEASDADFDWMLGTVKDRAGLRLPPGGVDDPVVLRIVRAMTRTWMIVREGEVVGLCSYKRPPSEGCVEIGFGIAPKRRGAGLATAGVAAIVEIASNDPTINALTAETATANLASQRVLEKNGFVRTGRRRQAEGDVAFTRFRLNVRNESLGQPYR
jgi:RimJ/RimL family protein N-acetyltransferase